MKPLFDVERQELAAQLVPSYRATQIFKSVYQRWAGTFEEMTDLPKQPDPNWRQPGTSRPPRIHRRFDSTDGTRRYLVPLDDAELAETVFIPEVHRNTICISSQVGCALACTFCLTGKLGLKRHLTAGEIVGQVIAAQRDNFPCRIRIRATASTSS